jgi:hypothetical protein
MTDLEKLLKIGRESCRMSGSGNEFPYTATELDIH